MAEARSRVGAPTPAALSASALLLPRTPTALGGVAAALANAALRVAIVPLFVTPLTDRVLAARDLTALPGLLALGAAVVGAGSAALYAQDALLGSAAAQQAAVWRRHLYAALLGRRPDELPGTSGGLASRILGDLREVETYLQYGLGSVVAEGATALGVLAVLLASNAPATGLLLLAAVPTVFALRWLGRRLESATDASQAGVEAIGSHVQEGLKHHEVVRAFGADAFLLDRFGRANAATRRAMTRRTLLAAAQVPVAQLLVFGAVAAVVAVLARAVARGAMSPGEVVGFVTLVALLATPAQLLPRGAALAQQARAAGRRLRALEADGGGGRAEHARTAPAAAVEDAIPGGSSARLELRDVSFAYPGGRRLFEHVDLRLDAPGLVALVGESGAGKSTLLRLLLGFLRPDAGEVALGGVGLTRLREGALRRAVAYVPQGTPLLRADLRDNLRLGRDLPDDELWRALAEVGLDDAVRALPAGLDTELREDGTGLSGGQQQRMALARALLQRPGVLLLDEPTANLDAAAEAALVGSLTALARRLLIVVVAHRPALVAAASRVLQVDGDGTVREGGRLAGG